MRRFSLSDTVETIMAEARRDKEAYVATWSISELGGFIAFPPDEVKMWLDIFQIYREQKGKQ